MVTKAYKYRHMWYEMADNIANQLEKYIDKKLSEDCYSIYAEGISIGVATTEKFVLNGSLYSVVDIFEDSVIFSQLTEAISILSNKYSNVGWDHICIYPSTNTFIIQLIWKKV